MVIPKGYKQTEVGVIPENWEVSTLEKYYNLFAGGDLDVNDYSPQRTSQYQYCILSNSLQRNGVYGFCRRPKYKGNSVTITGRGDVGHSVYRPEPFSAIVRLLVCEPKREIDSHFIAVFLENTMPFFFESTGVPQLTVPQIKHTAIPVPQIGEQHRIASAVADMDSLISALEKLSAKKKAIKQGTLQELLTGKRRIPGFSGEWTQHTLSELGSFRKGGGISRTAANSGKLRAVRYGELYTRHHNYVREYHSHISEEVAQKALPVHYGDLLFAASGETKEEIGMCAAIVDDCEAYAGGDIIVFTPEQKLHPIFMGTLLNASAARKQKAERGQGDAIVHIHTNSLAGITISIPSYEEQEAIAKILSDMDAEIEALERKLAKLRQVKRGMVQQLLTGKIRLA